MNQNLIQLESDLSELVRRKEENRLYDYTPYPKQKQFHDAGRNHRERLFMAGNQLGKTLAGASELTYHLTGEYPDWWEGKVFDSAIRAWCAGVTNESTRDNPQRLLAGPADNWGTGTIPRSKVLDIRTSRFMVDGIDSLYVRHRGGGTSYLGFKSYEKGREKWQGESLEVVWFDEEPPQDIYSEGLTRTVAREGIVYLTFTPLLGMSNVVRRFKTEDKESRHVTQMEIEEAEHISAEKREEIVGDYLEHEREARAKGIPVLGSGRVYPVTEEGIRIGPIPIPDHWYQIAGMDVGWDDPTALVWLAWDKDNDAIYVTDCYKKSKETPIVHASSIKARGKWIPVAWPADALQHDKGSGDVLKDLYKKEDVRMLHNHARYPDQKRANAVEAGVLDILQRMQRGRFKIFGHLEPWFDEFRLYHRKDGKIVKENDHLMDATRYAMMMLREARLNPQVSHVKGDRYSRASNRKKRGSFMSA